MSIYYLVKEKFVVHSLLLIALFGCGFFVNAQAEKRRFDVTFRVNGESVEEFQVAFLLNGEEIVPERNGKTIFVPPKIYGANFREIGIRIFSDKHQVLFHGGRYKGYLEDDDILSDLEFGLDTDTSVITEQHLSKLSKEEKRSLRIRRNRDLCSVAWVTAVNVRVKTKNLIVDPAITRQYTVCDRKK